MSFFDAYDEAVSQFIETYTGLNAIRVSKEYAFEAIAKHRTDRKVTLPFASYKASSDITPSTDRYNDYMLREGKQLDYEITSDKTVRMERMLWLDLTYEIILWAAGGESLARLEIPLLWSMFESPRLEIVSKFDGGISFFTFITLENIARESGNTQERTHYKSSAFSARVPFSLRLQEKKKGVTRIITPVYEADMEDSSNDGILLDRIVKRLTGGNS